MFKILVSLFFFFSIFIVNGATGSTGPSLYCEGIPGCSDSSLDSVLVRLTSFIGDVLIQYTAVIAVISLMISGIIYLISMGEESKTKKAKNRIIWSLVGVFLSVSAWFIINFLNNLQIN